jgi:MFS family permease
MLSQLLRLATVDPTPLRHPQFRFLFLAQLAKLLGGGITIVAIPFQVYELTHSPLAVGLLGVVQLAATLSLAFVGGAFADANDRRRMVLLAEAGSGVIVALLVVNALLPSPQLWSIYALAALQAALQALERPALEAILQHVVTRRELPAAAALRSLVGTLGQLAGPAAGGLLIGAFGTAATYSVDVASFVVSLTLLGLMAPVPAPGGAARPSFSRVLEGLRYARGRPELLGTYAVDMVAMFFGMPSALFPAIADHLGGATVLGFLYSAPALGAFLAAGTSGWSTRVKRHGRTVILAATVWGVAIIGFGFANNLLFALAMLAVAGGADQISAIFRSVIWNETIPSELRGRLASIEMLSYLSGPQLGNAESGLVAQLWSIPVSVVSGGIMCVVGCVACGFLLPAFWLYDARRFQHPATPQTAEAVA